MELEIISMTPQEQMYSYSQSSQIEAQTGCIGHLRGDFGAGQEFFTSWFEHRGEYKTDEFMAELMKWSTACGRRMSCFSAGTV